jgi:hypothetical protein
MRLYILGRDTDDKGTQLEILTSELFASLGYEQIKMNVANDAGEVDVDAVHITPLPMKNKQTTIIAECKAHKSPLNMTDWLKFLGKLYIAKVRGANVAGCLVALSGVNGNVLGSYDSIKDIADVRLIDSTVLVDYLMRSHGLVARPHITRISDASGRTYLSVDLAYYQRKLFWTLTYDDGRFTFLGATGSYPDGSNLDVLKPMIQSELEAGDFVDLRNEAKLNGAKALARKFVICCAMLGDGNTSTVIVKEWLTEQTFNRDLPAELIDEAAAELVANGKLIKGERDELQISSEVENNLDDLREFLVDFGDGIIVTKAIGCTWWDRHVNEALLRFACDTVQAGLMLSQVEEVKALILMRLSARALIYALHPDPMIVTHRTKEPIVPLTEEMIEFDRNHFMRSLYNMLLLDFRTPEFAEYFYAKRRVDGISCKTNMNVYDRDGNEVVGGEVLEVSLIGEWHEKAPDGKSQFLHIASHPEFLESRKARANAVDVTGGNLETLPSK